MNKAQLIKKINNNWNKYHVPGCSAIHKVKKNAIFISAGNSIEHEKKKLEICYELRKTGCDFITEAVDNKTGLKRDIVDLSSGKIFEIETDKKRAERFKNSPDVIVIKLWED